jgi:hypothetical protein
MNSNQLTSILKQDIYCRKINGKVLSLDQVPIYVSEFPSWFIINTEISSEPGAHWLGLYFNKIDEPADFFDTFGKDPSSYGDNITKLLSFHWPSFRYINKAIQSEYSQGCGFYTLYFIIKKGRGYNFEKIISHFTLSNLNKNEKIVTHFITSHYSIPK